MPKSTSFANFLSCSFKIQLFSLNTKMTILKLCKIEAFEKRFKLGCNNNNYYYCYFFFHILQVRRAIQRGATAIIFDISDNPDAAKEVKCPLKVVFLEFAYLEFNYFYQIDSLKFMHKQHLFKLLSLRQP